MFEDLVSVWDHFGRKIGNGFLIESGHGWVRVMVPGKGSMIVLWEQIGLVW